MSEEKKPEKWERNNWILLSYKKKLGATIFILRKEALGYGKITFSNDNFSIGDFTINYIDILGYEIEKSVYLVINCLRGKKYRILIDAKSGRARAPQKFNSILTEELKKFEHIKIERAENFLKDIPKLYKEISFDDLTSRTGLPRTDLIKILENLISNKELKAEIRGDILKLKKEPEAIASPHGYTSETSSVQGSEKREGMLVFVSYATKDAELYKIPELARKLEEYKEIGEVLYWQEDMHDSIIEYMNDNLGRCNGVLLFCSPNALDSIPVKKEWMAAEALRKPIIPIFLKPEHIPPLLSDRLGFEFDTFDFQKNIREIYQLLLKKK